MSVSEKFTVVVGTNRRNSLSSHIGAYYLQLLQKRGCDSQLLSLIDLPADFTVSALYENRGKNSAFNQLRDILTNTDKYVFIVPEYNGSFPGVLKAFIDGLPYPSNFKNKKCALVGVSNGPQGASLALSHITDIFHYLGMEVHAFKLKLGSILEPTLEAALSHKLYVELMETQVDSFIRF